MMYLHSLYTFIHTANITNLLGGMNERKIQNNKTERTASRDVDDVTANQAERYV